MSTLISYAFEQPPAWGDCPEKGQAYGKRAKQATSALAFGKEVTLQTYGKDKYTRTLADVFLSDGTHVDHALVKDGCCW